MTVKSCVEIETEIDYLRSLVYKKRRKVGVEEREGTVVTVRQ